MRKCGSALLWNPESGDWRETLNDEYALGTGAVGLITHVVEATFGDVLIEPFSGVTDVGGTPSPR